MLFKPLLTLVLIGFCLISVEAQSDPAPSTSNSSELVMVRRVLELLYNNGLKLPVQLLKMLNIPEKTTDAPLVTSPESPPSQPSGN